MAGYLGPDRSAWRAHDAVALIEDGARLDELLVDVGDADPFLEKELKPELLERGLRRRRHPADPRRQPGYDHSYYFISTFMADHVAWHAERLSAMIAGLEPWAQEALRVGAGLAIGALVGLERGFKLRDQKAGHARRRRAHLHLARPRRGHRRADRRSASRSPRRRSSSAMLRLSRHRLCAASCKAKGDATSPIAAAGDHRHGFLAGSGSVGLALAAAAIIVLILALQGRLHDFVDRLDEKDVKALARFAVIALAVLPFLPDQPIRARTTRGTPSKLWWVVILVTGFSFAGYVANRIFGAAPRDDRHRADRRRL